jgi:phosphate transport system permease protein
MATMSVGVRERIAAASGRIGRVKRVDSAARALIMLGGVFIIACVLFIFLFIAAETLPLFRPASAQKLTTLKLPLTPSLSGDTPAPTLAFGIDEYQRYVYEVRPEAKVAFYRLEDGSLDREVPIPSLEGARVAVASRSLQGDFVAVGTEDGRVALVQVRFRPVFDGQSVKGLEIELRDRGLVAVDESGRPARDVSYQESPGGERLVAALVGESEIVLARIGEEGEPRLQRVATRAGERLTHVRLGRNQEMVASTADGELHHWDLGDEIRLTEAVKASDTAIGALEYDLGGNTVLVGDEDGGVSAWFRSRRDPDGPLALVRAHEFEPQTGPIQAIAPSSRERSFVTAAADGSIFLRHLTSERTLLRLSGASLYGEARALITPRADGILVFDAGGTLDRYSLANPHPEFSWRAVWGKVWYEGYSEPEYVWQSTGGTDDFEPKLSLVPLVFGTIKATFYALIFAVPLAVLAALYTSQFVHHSIRARVKPMVEIMAALPSVVIGFIAGLWLSPRVETSVVPVLLLVIFLPLFGTAGVLFWERLPRSLLKQLRQGMEVFVIVPLILLGGVVAFWIGSSVESFFFGGDFKTWLSSFGLIYDQRNSVVVGIAMGFAVIPIIFTISEDAFSSVPQHLTAASLALGASRWQTATRVVLPTASPGIFSATMVGFGRAVGETMIVLMATGNTPLLDWSPFNGMRTLSANTAVEIAEAPHGGTLFRVLFLSSAVLFLMTFVVNTAAELVRQRLREKYKAI